MTAEPILLDYLRPRDWRQLARAAVLLDLSAGDWRLAKAAQTVRWHAAASSDRGGTFRGLGACKQRCARAYATPDWPKFPIRQYIRNFQLLDDCCARRSGVGSRPAAAAARLPSRAT